MDTDTDRMSKSDPISNKEILVAVGTVLFAVLVVTATVTIGPQLSEDELIRVGLGVFIASFAAILILPWWSRQDARRRERRHIREYHSDDPKP
jgi:uncharacterized membrane protein YccC